jgi:hypothetical protein
MTQKQLEKRDSIDIKKEFISKLNKFKVWSEVDTGFVNLIEMNEKWKYHSDKKSSTFIINFGDK